MKRNAQPQATISLTATEIRWLLDSIYSLSRVGVPLDPNLSSPEDLDTLIDKLEVLDDLLQHPASSPPKQVPG